MCLRSLVMHDSPPLTSADVAVIFGVDGSTVARWADEGKLPHFRTPGGHLRFRRQDIAAFLDIAGSDAEGAA